MRAINNNYRYKSKKDNKIYENNLMEEKEKYYIPDIKEFYVGFEFEHLNYEGKLVSNHPSNKREWSKEICDADWFNLLLDDYEHDIEEIRKYRIKYLDQEDIESLGWIYSTSREEWEIRNKYSYYYLKFKLDHHYDICYVNTNHEIHIPEYMFRYGIIKNKSELKKLMKQLNIINKE